MYVKGNKYKTRIATMAKGEKDSERKLYVADEIFEGNPMDSDNPVNFDYIENFVERKEKSSKERRKQHEVN